MTVNSSTHHSFTSAWLLSRLIALSAMAAITGMTLADVPATKKHEVDHLISFVSGSECVFQRNGKDYPGGKAIDHINQKYDYFRKKISTTEDFIAYSASKSTMSGRVYTVSCADNSVIEAQEWLLDELDRYRKESGG